MFSAKSLHFAYTSHVLKIDFVMSSVFIIFEMFVRSTSYADRLTFSLARAYMHQFVF